MQHTVTQFEAEIGTAEYLKDYVDVDYFLSCCKVCQNYGHGGNMTACTCTVTRSVTPANARRKRWKRFCGR